MARAGVIRRTLLIVALVAIVVVGGAAARYWYRHSRGVEVRLHNAAGTSLRSVRVDVTGRSYSLGDLAIDARTSVWVNPTSDSAVTVTFTTSTGSATQVGVPSSYIEPGYVGWMSVDLTTTEAHDIENHVSVY